MLWRDLDTDVYMIRYKVPLHYPALLLPGQFMKYSAQPFSNFSIDRLATILRYE